MAEQWLSIVEYARTFSVSDMTVRRRIKTGKLHAVLKEGKYFIPVAPNQSSDPLQAPTVPQEMVVVRGHPRGEATIKDAYAPTASVPAANIGMSSAKVIADVRGGNKKEAYIPDTLSGPMQDNEHSLVDTRALLAFCDASLRKFSDLERRQVEKFKAKLEAVEAQVLLKDKEIIQLKQQVEDLQLLVKIIESKKDLQPK